MRDDDALSLTFAALADPSRRAVLERLGRDREVTVGELAAPLAISLPAVSKHLKVLEGAGLVTRTRDGVRRPARLEAGPLREARDWIESYRDFWEGNLDRLDGYLTRLQGGDGNDVRGEGDRDGGSEPAATRTSSEPTVDTASEHTGPLTTRTDPEERP